MRTWGGKGIVKGSYEVLKNFGEGEDKKGKKMRLRGQEIGEDMVECTG